MHVLVVDDDPAGLQLRRLILERCGHQVSTAANVAEARAGLGAEPDVILMDLHLPEAEDGLALLRDLHQVLPGVRVVVFSGFVQDIEGHPERAYASEILPKPVRTERLLKALAS